MKSLSTPKRQSSIELRKFQVLIEGNDNEAVDLAVDELIERNGILVDLLLEARGKYERHKGMIPVFKALGYGISRAKGRAETQKLVDRNAATIAKANAALANSKKTTQLGL